MWLKMIYVLQFSVNIYLFWCKDADNRLKLYNECGFVLDLIKGNLPQEKVVHWKFVLDY